jgi:hypothetical protein
VKIKDPEIFFHIKPLKGNGKKHAGEAFAAKGYDYNLQKIKKCADFFDVMI